MNALVKFLGSSGDSFKIWVLLNVGQISIPGVPN